MQKNVLKSGIELSELGLGCMSLGTDINQAEPIIERAIEHGITYFDTADIYDKGVNEDIVGKTLKKYQDRSDIVIGSKVGNHLADDGSTFWDPSKAYIKEAVKGSLSRLGLDHLDLYQLHGGTIDDPLDETIAAFDELKQEGIIRAYAKKVKVLARGPVFKGLLTSNSNQALDRKFSEGIFDYTYPELGETVASIKEIESNLSSLTFNYLTSHDALGSIIVGASSVNQLDENVENYKLSKDISLEKLKAARDRVKNLEYTKHLK